MSGSSSNNRRRPCRNRTWLCASKQRIFLPEKIISLIFVRGGHTSSSLLSQRVSKTTPTGGPDRKTTKQYAGRVIVAVIRAPAHVKSLPKRALSCDSSATAGFFLHPGKSAGTLHQVKSSTYAALLYCRR